MIEYVVDTLSEVAKEMGVSPCSLCDLRDTVDCARTGIDLCTANDVENDYIRIKPVR